MRNIILIFVSIMAIYTGAHIFNLKINTIVWGRDVLSCIYYLEFEFSYLAALFAQLSYTFGRLCSGKELLFATKLHIVIIIKVNKRPKEFWFHFLKNYLVAEPFMTIDSNENSFKLLLQSLQIINFL